MLLLYAKYAFIFWLLVGSADQRSLKLLQQLSTDEALLMLSACTAHCLQAHRIQYHHEQQLQQLQKHHLIQEREHMEERQSQDFGRCFDFCKNGDNVNQKTKNSDANAFRKVSENFNMQLICRTDRSLSFRIDLTENLHYNGSSIANETKSEHGIFLNETIETSNARSSNLTDVIYIIKINQALHAKESLVYLSDDNFFMVDQLKQNMTYNLTVLAMHANMHYSMITQDELFTTLRRGFHPNNVTGIEINKFELNPQRPYYVTACLQWKPSADKNCFYEIIYFSVEKIGFDEPIEYRDPRKLYRYVIENLEFGVKYNIGVRSINIFNKNESEVVWLYFEVPPCLYWYKNNYSLCAPDMPTGLSVFQRHQRQDSLSLNISWDKPELLPDNYTVRVFDLYQNGTHLSYKLSKEKQRLFIPSVTIRGSNFGVLLTAYSGGGNSTIDEIYMKMPLELDRENAVLKLVFFLIVSIFCIVMFIVTLFCSRESKLNHYKEACQELENPATTANKQQSTDEEQETDIELSISNLNELEVEVEEVRVETVLSNDEMEVSHKDVELHEILGEGAFGLVRRGKFKEQDVAVKMLRDNPTIEDTQAFRREIEFMKSVGKHPNIIGLVGHCTKERTSMMLLIEYCRLGNLLQFLRDEYQFRIQQRADLSYKQSEKAFRNEDDTERICNQYKICFDGDNSQLNEESHIEDLKDELTCQSMDSSSSSSTPPTIIEVHGTPINDFYVDDEKKLVGYNNIFDMTNVKEVNNETIESDTIPQKETMLNEEKGYGELSHNSENEHNTSLTLQNEYDELPRNRKHQHTLLYENFIDINVLMKEQNYSNIHSNEFKRLDTIFEDSNECEDLPYRKNSRQLLETVENREYFNKVEKDTIRKPIDETDLLLIARQVAVGMEFLSKNKIVHRDLAARNVLVAADRTIKIADFGLSRDIYHENVYRKTGGGKLPVKWLAIESLTHQVYTTKSDVWSFGILLYEIMTLGSSPYPTVTAAELISMLRRGYRNEQPPECSDEIYAIMKSCWKSAPADRPNFGEIKNQLDDLLHGKKGIKNYEEQKIKEKEQVNVDVKIQPKIITAINEPSETTPYLQPIN